MDTTKSRLEKLTPQAPSLEDIFGPVISSYSRAQAIEDGILVDVSETAREAGIRFPVCLTRAAWEQCVTVPKDVHGQDEQGRLWDVLWMLRCAMKRATGSDLTFSLIVQNRPGGMVERRDTVQLRALCGPGDDAAPVVTVMQPGED